MAAPLIIVAALLVASGVLGRDSFIANGTISWEKVIEPTVVLRLHTPYAVLEEIPVLLPEARDDISADRSA